MVGKVYGFDEQGFRRAKEAIRRIESTSDSGARRRRHVPITARRAGGSWGNSLTGGCTCNNQTLIDGFALGGDPTVCCSGHGRFSINLGDTLGSFILYHAGGDIWSTFNQKEALDNPLVVACNTPEDAYDIVMDIAANTIVLEPRELPLNCSRICFEYRRSPLFSCYKANEFRLARFENAFELELPACVCPTPLSYRTPTGDWPACNICSEAGPSDSAFPRYISVSLSAEQICCFGDPVNPCEELNTSFVMESLDIGCSGNYGPYCTERYYFTALYGYNSASLLIFPRSFGSACAPGSGFSLGGVTCSPFFGCVSDPPIVPGGLNWDKRCSATHFISGARFLTSSLCGEPCSGAYRCGNISMTMVGLGDDTLPLPPKSSGHCTGGCGG